jgi:hypothetical protein
LGKRCSASPIDALERPCTTLQMIGRSRGDRAARGSSVRSPARACSVTSASPRRRRSCRPASIDRSSASDGEPVSM